MLSELRPLIEISRWLTKDCGLPFKEATELRLQGMHETGENLFSYSTKSQANLNLYHAKIAEERKAATVAKRNATRAANKKLRMGIDTGVGDSQTAITELPPRPPEVPACITCGDETFKCFCDVKRVDDIPF